MIVEALRTDYSMTKTQIRVLVVAAEVIHRQAVRRAIAADADADFVLFEAATGQEGLQLACHLKPDCILLDDQLPDRNSLAFLSALDGDAAEMPMPVILLTGADNVQVVAAEAIKRGAWDYLGKDANGQYLETLPWAIKRMLRERQLSEGKRRAEAELRQLAGRFERIKEAERKRIAQEIHDELGGLLTGIKAYVSVHLDRTAKAGLPLDPLLVDAVALADSGFQAVRKVITDLRPDVLDQLGIWAALEWYAGHIEKRSGISCACTIDASAAAIEPEPDLGTMLFRIVQEALVNAERHAKASKITVSAAVADRMLVIEVRDNGKGIDTDPPFKRESWGLAGMHERARYVGGELTISGKPGAGSAVVLRLPMESSRD
ncbi:MAG: Histidine kinase, gyrase and HSP90-like ATPase [Herbaspirillum sp.]|jgi:signal transduction histidine kinase|nr:Histidine kinase, gyrase and HSP90-like ATPase [Herbaspirillum sp.]